MSIQEVREEPLPTQPEEERAGEVERFGVPIYTSVLIACFVAVTAAQLYAGLIESVDAAGFVKPLFVEGEYWRLLTGIVLHGGLAHLFLNSFAFFSFGRLFEYLSNRAHLAIVFLLAGVGGSLMSLAFNAEGTSVGASGGILGIVSYLAVYAFRRRQFVSREFRNSLLKNIGFIIVFGLVLYQIVDNYGHIGGLLAGAVYGGLQIPSDPYRDPRNAGAATEALGVASLGVFIAVSAFSIFVILAP